MEKNRAVFFQILLLILALAFILTVKYVDETRSTEAGSFGNEEFYGNVTVTDVFSALGYRKEQ